MVAVSSNVTSRPLQTPRPLPGVYIGPPTSKKHKTVLKQPLAFGPLASFAFHQEKNTKKAKTPLAKKKMRLTEFF